MAYNVLQSMILQLVRDRGLEKTDAEKIATKHLQDTGYLLPGTMKLSEKGKEASQVDWNQRKIERAAKTSGLPEYYFTINMKGRVVRNPLFSK